MHFNRNNLFHHHVGFTMYEFLAVLMLTGLLALALVPRIIASNETLKMNSNIKDAFATVGDLYLSRKQTDEYILENSASEPEVLVDGPEDLTDGNENLRFAHYLSGHLNYSYSNFVLNVVRTPTYASGISSNTLCSTADDYFVLPSGIRIRNICNVSTAPRRVTVTILIPRNETSYTTFQLIIPEDTANSGKTQNRYTTLVGYTATTPGDCTYADSVLRTNTACPSTFTTNGSVSSVTSANVTTSGVSTAGVTAGGTTFGVGGLTTP